MKKKIKIRTWIQLVLFILIALIAVNHTLAESGGGIPFLGSASLHTVCPFGGVVSIYNLLTDGTFIKKIHESSLVLMIVVFTSTLILGPLFCGWICPLGTFQEWMGWLGKRIFKKKYNRFIPYGIDKYLRWLRYGVLTWVLYMTAVSGILIFQDFDPYYALFQFWTGEVALTGFITLGIVIILSLFTERPFCKYACPYGAVLGVFNLFRIIPLRRNPETCIDCGACDRACPVNIPVSKILTVKDHQCISCYECTSGDGVCPIPETMEFRTDRYKAGQKQACLVGTSSLLGYATFSAHQRVVPQRRSLEERSPCIPGRFRNEGKCYNCRIGTAHSVYRRNIYKLCCWILEN